MVMEKVHIVRNGKAAKEFDAVQILSNYFEEEKALEAALRLDPSLQGVSSLLEKARRQAAAGE